MTTQAEPVAVATRRTEKIRIEQHGAAGLGWLCAWLFTIGLLHLTFWNGLLALVIWPYDLGLALSRLMH